MTSAHRGEKLSLTITTSATRDLIPDRPAPTVKQHADPNGYQRPQPVRKTIDATPAATPAAESWPPIQFPAWQYSPVWPRPEIESLMQLLERLHTVKIDAERIAADAADASNAAKSRVFVSQVERMNEAARNLQHVITQVRTTNRDNIGRIRVGVDALTDARRVVADRIAAGAPQLILERDQLATDLQQSAIASANETEARVVQLLKTATAFAKSYQDTVFQLLAGADRASQDYLEHAQLRRDTNSLYRWLRETGSILQTLVGGFLVWKIIDTIS